MIPLICGEGKPLRLGAGALRRPKWGIVDADQVPGGRWP